MRFTLLVALIMVILVSTLVGCGSRSETPSDTVVSFTEAIKQKDTDRLKALASRESQVMVTTNLARGYGVAAFAMEAANSERGINYILVEKLQSSRRALVFLKNGSKGMRIFDDPTMPPSVKKQGLKFILLREKGQWKIDLFATEGELWESSWDYFEKRDEGKFPGPCPKWVPGIPGMPSPPEYPESKAK